MTDMSDTLSRAGQVIGGVGRVSQKVDYQLRHGRPDSGLRGRTRLPLGDLGFLEDPQLSLTLLENRDPSAVLFENVSEDPALARNIEDLLRKP